MKDKRKELISSIVNTRQYKEMNLPKDESDDFIVKDDNCYIFSKSLFDLDSKLFSVMRNVYNLDVVPHRHDFYEIQYVYSGTVIQVINGKEVSLKKGTLTLFNKHVSHNIKAGKPEDRLYHVAVDESVLNDSFFSLLIDTNPVVEFFKSSLKNEATSDYLVLDYSHPIFEQYFENIEKEYFYRQVGYEKNIMMYLALIFNKNQQYLVEDDKTDAISLKLMRIKQIKRAIDEQFRDITLLSLSEQLHVHPNYLSRFISNQMDTSFNKLLKEVRVKKACYMLIATDSIIEDISEEIGYRNVNYFYKVFKELHKMTPSQYRKQVR